MTVPDLGVHSYRFELFEAYPESGELLKSGARVKLQEQPFRLLCLLLENQGQLVSRDTIRDYLWPQNTFVEFDASLRVAVAKLRDALRDDSESPRFIETVPKRGYRFLVPVERILKPDTSSTAGVAAEVPRSDLSRTVAPASKSFPANFPSNALRALFIVVVAAAVVVFFLGRSRGKGPDTPTPSVTRASAPVRRSVAILGFKNLQGRSEEDWLSPAFTEMLGTELGSDGAVRIVSDEDVARAKREVPEVQQATFAKSTLEKFRTNLGADVVIVGGYTSIPAKDGNHVRLDVQLQDTSTGETISESAVSGNESDLFDLASRAGAELRKSLGLASITPQDVALARAALPSNEEAERYYAEARAKQEMYDPAGAKVLLLKAIAVDPDYPLAHAYLADAWARLGYHSRALSEAKRSLELSWKLPPEGRLLLEGSYRTKLSDWDGAAKAYGELYRMRPDNLDYGLQLAAAQYPTNPSLALATLREVRGLPAPMRDDPRIDFVESSAQMYHDISGARAAAQAGIAKAEAMGSPTLAGVGYGLLCQQGVMSGTAASDNIANCEKAHSDYMAAGQPNNAARSDNDLAGIYFQQGDLAHAETLWRQSAAEFLRVGDTAGSAATSNNLGDVLLKQGKLEAAEKALSEAKAQYQANGDNSGVAGVLTDLALIAKERGELTSAADAYSHARALAEQVGDKSTTAIALTGIGDVEFERVNFAAARKAYEQSIDIETQANEKQAVGETRVALARVLIAEGHAAEAEKVLRECRDQFKAENEAEDELNAGTVLIVSLVAQGESAEADAEMKIDSALLEKNQNRIARMEFAIASARASTSNTMNHPSRVQLERTVTDARTMGLQRLELEARLALGEWDKRAGRADAARTELIDVAKTARSKGFERIAQEAAAAGG